VGKTDWGSKDSLDDSTQYREKWKREGDEDRTAAYQRWRRLFKHGAYVTDIDQIEYRRDNEGAIYPVATLELTRIDPDPRYGGAADPSPGYFASILKRYKERDDQGQTAKTWAWLLGIPCYIVAYKADLSAFWLYRLNDDKGWVRKSADEYKRFIIDMRGGR